MASIVSSAKQKTEDACPRWGHYCDDQQINEALLKTQLLSDPRRLQVPKERQALQDSLDTFDVVLERLSQSKVNEFETLRGAAKSALDVADMTIAVSAGAVALLGGDTLDNADIEQLIKLPMPNSMRERLAELLAKQSRGVDTSKKRKTT